MKTLLREKHWLSSPDEQVKVLSNHEAAGVPSFAQQLDKSGVELTPTGIDTFQVNVGKMCNQVCKHCHVDAGPDRKEIMTRETMQQILDALEGTDVKTVDLTGGAPEMNPDFRWFVEALSEQGRQIIVRCNLTIILANPKYHDLPDFFKKHGVNVVSSLPSFTARRTNAQRGNGVFEKSIEALKMLNAVGYGKADSGLKLDLVYNPSGAFLPDDQAILTQEFKHKLKENYDIVFNDLFVITNLPVSRFLDYLLNSKNYESYMDELANAYNPVAAAGVMCRNMVSISWDGYLYDCDFNQMLELKLSGNAPKHVKDFDWDKVMDREIVINQHCYGCTAGAGSSCGGATT
ncbi:arsenosugar biosynthesis radical SAM (seleno)protein ArsS [Roseivirga pacifica]|uniref:arsenosugar biosynthesis radical SAM (seleno)protein ArsS n=1 Tax=Roseivirga pacifica TaxID=1267423 RepID=UPI00209524F6|nr:arsenosugar biosynthesis radical SAM (seleno)protein ArsS [Roseivirga pacifica]MCO6357837.1 radical SAM/Cys-rich domain protein [Roseivirga pacifica]MCO6366089.1 radical SAM/Cys-rich domain protein [Roseivirga pacifica]MCO6371417.1 radical SAM/Cys-rich domain protein [Roseivirga pacifica]MCO6375411.1 radical SAM/Cys-rich domain protein [Roseivirga pacifica]MCO6378795.1 radical SAM/Cys-rich domain protein [Roseivirga pacifica]